MSRLVGRCGLCCGRVTVPDVWMGTTPPPVPTCESCGAVLFESEHATLPMQRPTRLLTVEELRKDSYLPQGTTDAQLEAYVSRWNAKVVSRFS